jgi:hypothetical protein
VGPARDSSNVSRAFVTADDIAARFTNARRAAVAESSLIANPHSAWQTGDWMNLAVFSSGRLRLEAAAL